MEGVLFLGDWLCCNYKISIFILGNVVFFEVILSNLIIIPLDLCWLLFVWLNLLISNFLCPYILLTFPVISYTWPYLLDFILYLCFHQSVGSYLYLMYIHGIFVYKFTVLPCFLCGPLIEVLCSIFFTWLILEYVHMILYLLKVIVNRCHFFISL